MSQTFVDAGDLTHAVVYDDSSVEVCRCLGVGVDQEPPENRHARSGGGVVDDRVFAPAACELDERGGWRITALRDRGDGKGADVELRRPIGIVGVWSGRRIIRNDAGCGHRQEQDED